jgi:hypothetical protein
MPDGQVDRPVLVSGEIGLDPPGITVEEFYVD